MGVTRVSIRSATFPNCYLRMDGTGISTYDDQGAGRVDCQSFAGPMETLMIHTSDDTPNEFAIGSSYFEHVYLRMDATTFTQASAIGGGVVNCQYSINTWETFRFVPQPDGTKAIESVHFPGMFLRMDGTMKANSDGYGGVNCQMSVGPWEKFIVSELNDGLNRAELEEAIAKYGPILKLHKDEIYDNCSVEWFLEHAHLIDSKEGTTTANPAVSDLPQVGWEAGRYWLELDDAGKSGDFSTAKAYVRARWTQGMTYTDLQFWFFSAYNGPGTGHVNGLLYDTIVHSGDPNLAPLGEHVGDWECCIIRLDNESKNVLEIILSQHGEAVSFSGDKMTKAFQWVNGTQPVVYSSRNGHALYPSADSNLTQYHKFSGMVWLAYVGVEASLRNDTSEGGKSLDCSKHYQVVSADFLEKEEAYDEPGWVNYHYRWGPEGTATKMTAKAVSEVLHAAIGWLADTVPGRLVELLGAAILPHYVTDDLNGPGAPIGQGIWDGQE
ncbi:hypothetical protein V498_08288 [Pseudogymnoascus sp. VKM F-4517 (FW-2822)]|nr:hypothetical protein V498_08288 [Pseudogymnoascus sp. VKM F-4517 (FW-2822)]